ncbi:pyruvate, phosphate dikinase [Paraglaciecola sp. MB-3u-78]|uniref:pyruvate, phosphate dikinase n=1 Tax=Paraglaciecola sp. MB-3u-78 TaxID=2058332 RepID=UPI000C3274C7|nr:pyruvate, phosphate dikinase [Paraglaciecola sp. MB-3u-78]PKG97175.1 pyruvate, phosphate dikinase [Paraglaciecola sp. MB-3u-78]
MIANAAPSTYVYSFKNGDGKNKKLLGGKGANLCEMTQIGINVPAGFVITTQACLSYLDTKNQGMPDGLIEQVKQQIKELEQATDKGFGDPNNMLLLSVRSGSAMSMPGMMDTILNLGLNSQTLPGLIKQTGNPRFAWDAYRRFVQLFGKVALGIADDKFDKPFDAIKKREGLTEDTDLCAEHFQEITQLFLEVVKNETGKPFPEDVYEQLQISIQAVFGSWLGKRAIDYRREFNITPDLANGTAVNVQSMVFGNMGDDCATGVGFTRNPGTGENIMFGEYLINAQGEDVVAGIRTPKAVQELEQDMPQMYKELVTLRNRLEDHYKEVQDYEYTIQNGVLFCLQTRDGKMNAAARVRTSLEMSNEGLITRDQALLRINPEELEQLLHPRLDPKSKQLPIVQGLPASPGAASGTIVFDADRAELARDQGENVILVREETKPEDIHGFFAAQGVLTSRGGKTSHAAVVARGMGKPCVAGAEGIIVDVEKRIARINDTVLHEGDTITIDGANGNVYLGKIDTVPPQFSDELQTLLSWADEISTLKIMANADTMESASKASDYGAMGIGLCRTERMFNAQDRLPLVIDMILAKDKTERQKALDVLRPIQKYDFKSLFKVMSPRPVTIRLLDPPIHEFLPSEKQLEREIKHLIRLQETVAGVNDLMNTMQLLKHQAEAQKLPKPFGPGGRELVESAIAKKKQMLLKVRELFEVNPMLGHRGVRLGITYPEIYEMQIRAILEAAAECTKEGIEVRPEIMVPQVCTNQELIWVRQIMDKVLLEVEAEHNIKIKFKFGSMIEVVRACMRAGHLAETAEFFSFGTNDLTQSTFSFSREDAENKFLPLYEENHILQDNPFETLDVKGVGRLMEMAVQWGRKTNPDLKVGICGEQAGHPESIRFCHHIGLSYVSCSAPRVPIARLAAAQAKLTEKDYSI